jgi:hypothetical protein
MHLVVDLGCVIDVFLFLYRRLFDGEGLFIGRFVSLCGLCIVAEYWCFSFLLPWTILRID